MEKYLPVPLVFIFTKRLQIFLQFIFVDIVTHCDDETQRLKAIITAERDAKCFISMCGITSNETAKRSYSFFLLLLLYSLVGFAFARLYCSIRVQTTIKTNIILDVQLHPLAGNIIYQFWKFDCPTCASEMRARANTRFIIRSILLSLLLSL